MVELQNQGVRRVYVGGGITIQSFLQKDLLTEITITTVPIILGKWIPLYGLNYGDFRLELLERKSFKSDFVQSRYRFIR